MKVIKRLPDLLEVKTLYCLTSKEKGVKTAKDLELRKILKGESEKFIVIVGPCSADNEYAVREYAERLSRVSEALSDKLFIMLRLFTGKSRSSGSGGNYFGMIHQPDSGGLPNLSEGIISSRRLHVRILSESGLTTADEMLYPDYFGYVEDVVSYAVIGARSAENQQHRLAAGGLDIPVGIKNPTSGDIGVMLRAVSSAQAPNRIFLAGCDVETDGNAFAHAIVRGYIGRGGRHIPNYQYNELTAVIDAYLAENPKNPSIIVDTNHSNSGKDYMKQPQIAYETLALRKKHSSVKSMVKGLLIESYIEPGAQSLPACVFGQSITDACLGWEETRDMLYTIADSI